MKPLQITQSPSVLLDIGRLPEKYAYEFQMLIREFLPFARFCTSEEEADLSLRIHDQQVLLSREGEQKIQLLSDGTPSLTGDPYKNRIKKAIYELLSELTGTRLPWGILTGVRPTKIAYAALDKGSSQEEIVHDLVQDFCLQEDKARCSRRQISL